VTERDKSERVSEAGRYAPRLPICTDWGNHSTSWLMRHRLGLRAVLTNLMDGVEIKGDEAMIEALADFSKRNVAHIKGILNLTIPPDESPAWILSQYLLQLGLSTEFRRPVEDGKRVRYYRLNTDDVAFAKRVLEYRQRQREEKQRRRQTEQEKHAAYTAIMQTIYGINAPSTPPINEDGSNNQGGMDAALEAGEAGEAGEERELLNDFSLPPLHLSPCSPCSFLLGGMDGDESGSDSWWQQVKSYTAMFMEQVKIGVDAVKEFLSSLTSDERWGVMVEMEEQEPVMFGQLVAVAPDWVQWMG
jgi:hypothetical protein